MDILPGIGPADLENIGTKRSPETLNGIERLTPASQRMAGK
jgi:hypothetical protein